MEASVIINILLSCLLGLSVIALIYNISVRQSLKRTCRQLIHETQKIKMVFVKNINHEIRTPLNAIVGFSNLLAMNCNEEERKRYAAIVEENSERLLDFHKNVMALSALEAGTFILNRTRFDVVELLREIYQESAYKAKEWNPRLSIEQDIAIDSCEVEMDRDCLKQVVMRLMVNAIKCTEEGKVSLSAGLSSKGIRIEVEDTGKGISLEDQKRVFEHFETVDSLGEGVNIGLALNKAMIKYVNGKIGCYSDGLGHGSKFWLWFPIESSSLRYASGLT